MLTWGEKHPGLLVYLVDLSRSMSHHNTIGRVSTVIWNVVDSLLAPCQDNGIYKERFHLKVIGYNNDVKILFEGGVNEMNKWLDDREDEQFIDIEREGRPEGCTYMAKAYDKASEIIRKWISDHKDTRIPAPIVINITDGYPEENGLTSQESREKALKASQELRNIAVEDGKVLLFNIHIENSSETAEENLFPSKCPTDIRQSFMFEASSELPKKFIELAKRKGINVDDNGRFLVINIKDMKLLGRLVVFGSTVSNTIYDMQ